MGNSIRKIDTDRLFDKFDKNRSGSAENYEPAAAIQAELGKGPITRAGYDRLVAKWGPYFNTGFTPSADDWGRAIAKKMNHDLVEFRAEDRAMKARHGDAVPPSDIQAIKELDYIAPVSYAEFLYLMNTQNKLGSNGSGMGILRQSERNIGVGNNSQQMQTGMGDVRMEEERERQRQLNHKP